jgi:hypothetical protein
MWSRRREAEHDPLADGHGVVRGAEIAEKDDRRQRFVRAAGATEAEERCRATSAAERSMGSRI